MGTVFWIACLIIQYVHDCKADIKPNQESFFFYSGFEHADFWGTVTVLSCAGQPSAPEAKVYYFRSLRKRGSAYENYDLVSKDSFFLAACSSQFQTVITRADYFAKSRIPVLLCGNDGDGRNLIARYIHTSSIRKYDHFVTVDCSEIPLLEQVDFVFGPLQSGMLTGVLWKANKGCIYFKNIEYMSLALQERIAGLAAQGDFCLGAVFADDSASQLKRNGQPLIFADAAIVMSL